VEFRTKKEGRRLYIFLQGELDDHAAAALRQKLDDALEEENMAAVIFDLKGLTFTDSTGVGLLIGHYKKLKSRNVPVYLKNVGAHAEKIFKMTGIYQIMPKLEEA